MWRVGTRDGNKADRPSIRSWAGSPLPTQSHVMVFCGPPMREAANRDEQYSCLSS